MALSHLAGRPGAAVASAREVAEQHGIPGELLAKVLQRLVRHGILTSVQGIHGGYRLARGADAISIAEVIEAIDGPLTLVACGGDADADCDQFARCNIRDPLERIRARIASALAGCTIQDLAEPREAPPLLPLLSNGARPDTHDGGRRGPAAEKTTIHG